MSDKRINSLYLALMASLNNMCQMVHRFHIFWVVETFGIFVPQLILSLIGLATMVYFKDSYLALNNLQKSDWQVSSKFFKDNPSKIDKEVEVKNEK